VLVYFSACALAGATTEIDPYDGAHHTVLAWNLASTGQYARETYGHLEVWPVEITVGPTLIVPMALGFRIAGLGPFVPNVVCAVLSLGLVAWLWARIVRVSMEPEAALSSFVALCLLLTLTVKGFSYFYLPYGEVVAGLLCCLAVVIVFGRDRPGRAQVCVSGVLTALAINCKFLALLPGLALGTSLWALPGVRPSRREALLLWLGGAAMVFALVEADKLRELGSLGNYLVNWRDFVRQLFRHSGSGLGAAESPLRTRVASHAGLLVVYLHWFLVPFAIALAAWPVLVVRSLRVGADTATRTAAVLGAEIVPMLVWFVALCGRPWLRYVLITMISLPVYAHFALTSLVRAARGPALRGALVVGWLGLLAAAFVVSPRRTVNVPYPSLERAPRTVALFAASDWIRETRRANPAARFWGSAWWRHWDLQTLVDLRPMADVSDPESDRLRTAGNDYLITSDFFDWEKRPRTQAILRDNAQNVVFRNRYFAIYRLAPPAQGSAEEQRAP